MLPEVTAKYTDWTQRTAAVKFLCSLLYNFYAAPTLNSVTDFLVFQQRLLKSTSWWMGLLLLKIIHKSLGFQYNKKYIAVTMFQVRALSVAIIASAIVT